MIKGYLEDDDYRAPWIYKKLKHQGYAPCVRIVVA
jgi:hypothetical protein